MLDVLKSMLIPSCLLDDPPPPSPLPSAAPQTLPHCPSSSPAVACQDRPDGEPGGSGKLTDPEHPATHQAPILLLLRTLCQSSQLSAQLIRSSGLLPLVQAHLLVGCSSIARGPSDPGASRQQGGSDLDLDLDLDQGTSRQLEGVSQGGSVGAASVQSQLCVLEALRVWRVCCHQGVGGLPTLEDVFPSVCRLLHPPTAAGLGSGSGSGSGGLEMNAPRSMECNDTIAMPSPLRTPSLIEARREALSTTLTWHVSREAHLLVSSLVLHAVQSSADKSLGRPLIQPGTAAAVAQETLQWIQPQGIRMVSEALVERAGGCWQQGAVKVPQTSKSK